MLRENIQAEPVTAMKAKDKGGLLKSFLLRFVCLHGMLHSSLRMSGKQLEVGTFIPALNAIISDLGTLLQGNALSDSLLLKLVTICVFSTANSLDKRALESHPPAPRPLGVPSGRVLATPHGGGATAHGHRVAQARQTLDFYHALARASTHRGVLPQRLHRG